MIVMDEFPTASLLDGRGQMDRTLFPHLPRFAGRVHLVPQPDDRRSAHDDGGAGDPDREFPSGEPVPTASEFPDSLFTLLGGSYRLNVHESATRICPSKLCGETDDATGANDGLGSLLKEGVSQWKTSASPERTSKPDALLHQSPYVETRSTARRRSSTR